MKEVAFTANKLFHGVPPELVERLGAFCRFIELEPGSIVFDEAEPGDDMFLVLSGCIRISKRGRRGEQETLTFLNPGDYFGEMSLFDASPRSARATAVERTVLSRVDVDDFRRMLAESPPEFMLNLVGGTFQRMRENDRMLIEQLLSAERLTLMGSMAAMMMHDFKNPISVIRGATELLEERTTDPSLVRLAGMINRSVDAMLAMIQDLLDYSRGINELKQELIPLGYVVTQLEELAFRSIESRGITVEREILLEGVVWMDVGRFLRAALNVVRNAGEVLDRGGMLRLSVYREDDWDSFVVSDTGPGIPEDMVARVFEPFVTRGKKHGTGLGLTIAKAAVEAHGGTISVSTAVGRGTTFVIRIPAPPAQVLSATEDQAVTAEG